MEFVIVFHGGFWNNMTYEGGRKEYIPIPDSGITFEELISMIEVRTKKNRNMHVFELDSLFHVNDGETGIMKITNQFEWSCILKMGKFPTVYVTVNERSKELPHPDIVRVNSVGSSSNSQNNIAVRVQTSTSSNSYGRMHCQPLVADEDSILCDDVDDVDIPSKPIPVGYIGIGSTFSDKDSMVSAVCLYHLKKYAEFFTKRSDKGRYHLVCKSPENCDFLLRARSFGISWSIKKFRPHKCVVDLKNTGAPKVKSKALAAHVGALLTEDGYVLRAKDIQGQLLREYGVNVKYSTALAGRNIALQTSYGNADESFQLVPSYLYMLQKMNPGSIVDLQTSEDNCFEYCYFSLHASIRAFLVCRPVIVVDATHLKGKFKGVMFVATTKDASEGIVPLAFGIGDKEDDSAWLWFLKNVRQSFGVRKDMLIVSDQHISIKNAVSSVFPEVAHGICTYHIQGNLRKCRVEGAIDIFQQAARAYRVEDFNLIMANLQSCAAVVHEKLLNIDPVKWANCKCPVRRYAFGTSNAVESLNGRLKWSRKLPICRLLEYIRTLMQDWFYKRRTTAAARTLELSKRAVKRLDVAIRAGRVMKVEPISYTKFKIISGDKSNFVDISERNCSCEVFQRDLFPCSHATCAIQFVNQSPSAYVNAYYSTATLLETYSAEIMPVPDPINWSVPEDVASIVVRAPVNPNQAGRPRLNRVQAGDRVCTRCKKIGHLRNKCTTPLEIIANEACSSSEPGVKRRRKAKKCGICGVVGHTRRKCNQPSRDN